MQKYVQPFKYVLISFWDDASLKINSISDKHTWKGCTSPPPNSNFSASFGEIHTQLEARWLEQMNKPFCLEITVNLTFK